MKANFREWMYLVEVFNLLPTSVTTKRNSLRATVRRAPSTFGFHADDHIQNSRPISRGGLKIEQLFEKI